MHGDFPCKYYYLGMEYVYKKSCKFSHGEPLTEEQKKIFDCSTSRRLLKKYLEIPVVSEEKMPYSCSVEPMPNYAPKGRRRALIRTIRYHRLKSTGLQCIHHHINLVTIIHLTTQTIRTTVEFHLYWIRY